jgi:mannitol/fructose-specific phosphotransferase system IIA component (Ntr-type)
MKKDEFLKMLKAASDLEESHSSKVARFFVEDFDWSDMDEKKVERAKKILNTIMTQTRNHEKILKELIKKVGQSDINEI